MIEINGERLLRGLRELARFGQVGTGVNRTALTPVDLEARRWLRAEMEAAGLEARLDHVGNVLGRAPGQGRAVLIGSHTDTVPNGGWLDGALGVMYGLEIARTLQGRIPGAVDVVSFQDEEGTFVPCLGSRSFCGALEEKDIELPSSGDGRRLRDELRNAALPEDRLELDPARHIAFLEAHIEQGPRLEESGSRIGVVNGIVGIRRYRIVAMGRADHAGTTPMAMRKDAGAALVGLAAALLRELPRWGGPESVWNIGKMTFEPGAANVVPAEAAMILEFRDIDPITLTRVEDEVGRTVAEIAEGSRVPIDLESIGRVEPIGMDLELCSMLQEVAERRGDHPLAMPSGAGHDAMILAPLVPTAMMFVPSIAGRSHHVSENTKDEDIVFGCGVLADAVARLCTERGRS